MKLSAIDKTLFILSLFVSLFWGISIFGIINIYHFALVGAIFELLWLPMILLLFALPIFIIRYWNKVNFNSKTAFPYSLILIFGTCLGILFRFFT
jgi:hypothetical protein